MKFTLEQHLHESSPSFAALIQDNIKALNKVLQIDEARVRIERNTESSPPFRLAAHLVTPGPDVSAEAVDHTPRAALQKLVAQLISRIDHRNQKRDQRLHGPVKTARKQGRA
ncbi:MAG: HPF/RaiA family ribosome-associated protein [Verrucomicrobiota bacterium]